MLSEDLMLLLIDEVAGGVRVDAASADHALAGAALLDQVRSGLVPEPARPHKAVAKLRRHVRRDVMARLEARGVLTVERTKVLGIFSVRTHVLHRPDDVREVRRSVGDVALGHAAPDERTRALISLLYAVRVLHKVFDGDKREMNARAKEIARGEWAGEAVKKAVRARRAAAAAASS
ncbi:GOLPH3/VPS74 family protein [Lentzea sp. CA-135723]|uniref:GOLPH3/VPS74 family protein n=1 Tax=Lentzea sp. CA-135723 TaxID=3239950 RepID=UPI003D93C947